MPPVAGPDRSGMELRDALARVNARLHWLHRQVTVPYWMVAVSLASALAGSTALTASVMDDGPWSHHVRIEASASSSTLDPAITAPGQTGTGSARTLSPGQEVTDPAAIRQQVDALRTDLSTLAADLERAQRENAALRDASQAQSGDLSTVQTALNVSEERRLGEVQVLEDRLEQLQRDLQARLAALEQTVSSAEGLVDNLRATLGMPQAYTGPAMGGPVVADLETARDPWRAAQAEMDTLEQRVAAVNAELATLGGTAQGRLDTLRQAGFALTGNGADDLAFWNNAPLGVPVTGALTSNFGMRATPFGEDASEDVHAATQFHTGIDLAVPEGTPVTATGGGVVRIAGPYGGYGNLVVIDHGRGISSWYGHNARIQVQPGQHVKRGDVIALAGSTGYSTGPHVHYEIRTQETPIDPMPFTRFDS